METEQGYKLVCHDGAGSMYETFIVSNIVFFYNSFETFYNLKNTIYKAKRYLDKKLRNQTKQSHQCCATANVCHQFREQNFTFIDPISVVYDFVLIFITRITRILFRKAHL